MVTEKSKNEFWFAEQFATAYNRNFQTDYVAEQSVAEQDSADAFLFSASQGHRIKLQISMVTTTERMHEEGIQRDLQQRISKTLIEQGITNCLINIVTRQIPGKNDFALWHKGVVELVLANFSSPQTKIEMDDGGYPSAFGALPFRTLTIYKNAFQEKWRDRVIVRFIAVKDVLCVGRTLQEAIDRKVEKKYSDSKDLWLLLYPGAGAYPFGPDELVPVSLRNIETFAQVWWVYPQRDIDAEIYHFK